MSTYLSHRLLGVVDEISTGMSHLSVPPAAVNMTCISAWARTSEERYTHVSPEQGLYILGWLWLGVQRCFAGEV